jgi:cytochrome P450
VPSTPVDARPRSERSRPAGRSSAPRRVRLAAPESTGPVEPAGAHRADTATAGSGRSPATPTSRRSPGVRGGRWRPTPPSSPAGRVRPTGESTKNLLLCMDPPRHTRVRRVGNRCFTPRALAGLEDDLRERAHRIVWAAKRDGTGDFVIDVARHLPLQAIAGLMGIPRRRSPAALPLERPDGGQRGPGVRQRDLSGVVEMFAYAHAAAEARVEKTSGTSPAGSSNPTPTASA